MAHRKRMFCTLFALLATSHSDGADNRPTLALTQRYRVALESGRYETRNKQVSWEPARTAIIVCDVWDAHHCLNAVRRLEEMLPVMNNVLEKARPGRLDRARA